MGNVGALSSAQPVRRPSGRLPAASSAAALLIGLLLTTACRQESPVKPANPAPAIFPSVSIVSMSVTSETQSSGSRMYRVTVKLRESAGVQATIAAIDLSFASASSVVASSHVDRPISDTSNICPANSTVDSRELTVKDDDPSHAHATSVTATVVFGDGSSATKTVSASASVPASSPPPPQVFTLAGVVSDDRTGAPIAAATVQTVGEPNGGKSSTTDSNGFYSIPGLTGGSVTIRAAANGYDTIEQAVTIAADLKIDLKLRATAAPPAPPPPSPPPSAPCAYTISPVSNSLTWMGGTFTITITRTSGSCSWQASSNVSWITFTEGSSGSGSGTLTYFITANGGVTSSNTRFGTVTITWSGGSADLAVQQGGASPELCRFTITVGGSSSVTVPSAGGQVSATVTWVNTGIPPSVCTGTASSEDSWITFVPPSPAPMFGAAGGTLTISVTPNPLPGFARSGTVSIRSFSGSVSLTVTQQ
jgi:Carboxypeptidase regulatory-like domain/Putative binding domain, N-terminal